MTDRKLTKKALLSSVVALVLCCAMLLGTTYAWFTDTATTGTNIIQSGNLDVEMYWAEGTTDPTDPDNWKDASEAKIFNYDKWEPGYVEVKHVGIANEGNLALKYQLNILANGEVSELAEVIDVYYLNPAQAIGSRDALNGLEPIGTLAELITDFDGVAYGVLLPEGTEVDPENPLEPLEAVGHVTATIALKMQETAGNEYQGLSLSDNGFSVQILATQYTWEEDSFNDQYDADAEWPVAPVVVPDDAVEVTNFEELKAAVANGGNIKLMNGIEFPESIIVSNEVAIYGMDNALTAAEDAESNLYKGNFFNVKDSGELTLYEVVVDGEGEYSFDENGEFVIDMDARRTSPIFNVGAGSTIKLGSGTSIENVVAKGSGVIYANGASGNRATVIIENASITNCAGESGTVINVDRASDVYIEEGTVITGNASYNNNNHGIIRVYNAWDAANPSTVTMNGGEINGNYYSGNGMIGLYYGKFIMNGGKICSNAWFENNQVSNGWYPVVYVHSNSQFEMNGGEISNNRVKYGVINSLNSSVEGAITINGGTVTNNIATNNDDNDAFAAVAYFNGTRLVVSDNANVTGTVWVYYDNDGNRLNQYYTLEDYFELAQ